MTTSPTSSRHSTSVLSSCAVSLAYGFPRYGPAAPFGPGVAYPEYPFPVETVCADAGDGDTGDAYAGVREALRLLDLDAERFDTAGWNPLGGVIHPGDTVVLKPNFVRNFRESSPDEAQCVITHGAILRAALDYSFIALGGKGRLIVADAPQNDADFAAIRRLTGLDGVQAFYRKHAGFEVEVYDLRPERADKIDGVIVGHRALPGDPAGYVRVNLGVDSAFAPINDLCHLLYGSEYDTSELVSHQHDDVHEYLISGTVLGADVVLSLPKLKTHKKVGLTVNLKNLVGINGNKNWLPHHREGTPSQGGDQFADDALKRRIERATVMRFKRWFPLLGPLRTWVARPIKSLGRRVFGDTNTDTVRSGNWYGNDTTWRMVLDLNRILYYAGADGRLHDTVQRRLFSIVDGVVAGEGNGPLDPRAKPCGVVLAGWNPVAVDAVCARVMGFDIDRIAILYRSLEEHRLPLTAFGWDEVMIRSNQPAYDGRMVDLQGRCLGFVPHFGWKGHIESARTGHETGAVA